ncbi:hypothetical protein GGH95_000307 [Coemansia sp. RSA 1836]|nr:hypothetical protein GGH95_000307 [Coemansia sp. RSA 1836]
MRKYAGQWLFPTLSAQQTSVFKAVLAYAIAALFPFVPVLRDWLGDPDYISPHLVTNATIWFHAAKTQSGLAEGGLVGVIWVCVTSCVTYLALYIAEWLHCTFAVPEQSAGGGVAAAEEAVPLAVQSKVVSLVVFVFGYSWCLAFFKANANRASVSTATAIANIALYLVMLREAPIVNYKVAAASGGGGGGGEGGRAPPWPDPGDRDSLAESVGKKTEHVLVAVLTGMAISLAVGWVVRPTTAGQELCAQLRTTFASFRRILPQLLAPIVSEQAPSNTQAKQRGAKSSELKAALREHRERQQQLRRQLAAVALEPGETRVWARRHRLAALVDSLDALGLHLSSMSSGLELRVIDHSSDAFDGDLDTATYSTVIARIRAPVVRLGETCDRVLAAVHDLVDAALSGGSTAPSDGGCAAAERATQLQAEMAEAMRQFHADYDAAVGGLPAAAAAAAAAGAGAPGTPPRSSSTTSEQLFIVCFFVFSLREFAGELCGVLLPLVAAVCQPPPPRGGVRRAGEALRALGAWALALARGLCDTGATTELEARYEVAQFADPQSLHAPRPTTRAARVARGVWRGLMWARRLNVRFATKYALLVTLLALPWYWSMAAYLEVRRQRLDWMVISAAAIMVPTVGGAALVSVYRILGTCAGGLAAFAVYEVVGRGAPAVTYALVVLFSVPCFHLMLHGRYPKIGQFALVTFGVVLINKWVAREDQAEGVGALAVRRTAAVALGIGAGMLVTVYVWPYEARVRVRQALSWWLLTASQMYARLWAANWQQDGGDMRRRILLHSACGEEVGASSMREHVDSEMHLQRALLEVRALLADTLNEPRLKGPFPLASYDRIINACQRLLDATVAARWVMLQKPESEEEGEETETEMGTEMGEMEREEVEELVRRTGLEREQRDSLVALSMYVLASALILKTPLPAVLPPIHAAQRRVADAMRDVLGPAADDESVSRVKYVFYYTQVMLGWEIVHELAIIGGLMRELYGSY